MQQNLIEMFTSIIYYIGTEDLAWRHIIIINASSVHSGGNSITCERLNWSNWSIQLAKMFLFQPKANALCQRFSELVFKSQCILAHLLKIIAFVIHVWTNWLRKLCDFKIICNTYYTYILCTFQNIMFWTHYLIKTMSIWWLAIIAKYNWVRAPIT